MAEDRITSGTGGNTSGTGGPEHSGVPEGAGTDTQQPQTPGEGDGDDVANRLGGLTGGGIGSANAAGSGDASAGRSSADDAPGSGAGVGDDPGSPGGMGGVRGGMPNPDHRPNGGVSPMGNGDEGERR